MPGRTAPRVLFASSLLGVVALAWSFDHLVAGDAARRQLWGLSQAYYHDFRDRLNARALPVRDARFSIEPDAHEGPPVAASLPGGVFDQPVTLTLTGAGAIHYTLDGSVPTRRSRRFREPIRVDSSMVVRARVLDEAHLPGIVSTWHFIISEDAGLPVMSIAMDPIDLWNKYSGIYAHSLESGRAWERAASVALFDDVIAPHTGFPAELRIHGGYTRRVPKKSMRIRYDTTHVAHLSADHPLRSPATRDQSWLIIRSGGSIAAVRIRDVVATELYRRLGRVVSRDTPVELYLNGRYWGLYDLRERIDEGFLFARFGPGNYELLEHDPEQPRAWQTVRVGDETGWNDALARLAGPQGAAEALRLFDVDGTLDYWIHNIYVSNVDWPYNNTIVWRRIDRPDRRWHWLAWDMDGTLNNPAHNTLEWSIRDRPRNDLKHNYQAGAFEDEPFRIVSTLPIRALLQTDSIRDRFVARTQVLLDLHYTEEAVLAVLDSALALPARARPRDFERWGRDWDAFNRDMELIRTFARVRPGFVRAHLAARFGLGTEAAVTVRVTGPGTVFVAGYPLRERTVGLTLLRGTRVPIHALPDPDAALAGPRADSLYIVEDDARLEYRFRP